MAFTKCPMCGYTDAPAASLLQNEMNQYVNDKDPKDIIVFNSVKPKIQIGSDPESLVSYTRKDLVGQKLTVKPEIQPATIRTTDKAGSSTTMPPAFGAPKPQTQG